MRSVVQRVEKAFIFIGEKEISRINRGLLVFLGVEKGDREPDADYLSEKIVHLRIFDDREGKMNCSLLDIKGEILVVSQFTLLGDCRKGRRPSFTAADDPVPAKKLYEYFIQKTRERTDHVAQGEFQALMSVHLVNDGPVTMLLDSKKLF
ncbi:MAG: D-tyrosyl-tRNA(Tyr) deacylase [Deltaproteobacteria bacterium]|jgi:D-tyrosyl-tRNA(Tyr) deacylase|nr:D-tyrosyl-tRNA(Tyr) deacylase [Deltaproteobacteria bacterium]